MTSPARVAEVSARVERIDTVRVLQDRIHTLEALLYNAQEGRRDAEGRAERAEVEAMELRAVVRMMERQGKGAR